MDTILTSSGLAVCYQGASYKTVAAALRRLDPVLLLDQQLDEWGRPVWCVKIRHGADPREWRPIVWWTDPDDTPRELSLGLVDQVRAQELTRREQIVSGTSLADSTRRVRERLADEARQEREDLIREHEKRLSPGHGKPVTFSTSLKTKGR